MLHGEFGMDVKLLVGVVSMLLCSGMVLADCDKNQVFDSFSDASQPIVRHPLTGDVDSIAVLEERIRSREAEAFAQKYGRSISGRPGEDRAISEVHQLYETLPSKTSLPCGDFGSTK